MSISRPIQPHSPLQPARADDFRTVVPFYAGRYQPLRVQFLGSGGGFSGASLWRLESPGGLFCLRTIDAASVDRDRVLGLHRLLAHIHACGFAALPVPVPALNGTTLIEAAGRVWQLEPWLPGTADFTAHPTERRLRAAVTMLAHWHRAAATFRATASERPWFFVAPSQPSPGISERLREIARWDESTRDLIRRQLTAREPFAPANGTVGRASQPVREFTDGLGSPSYGGLGLRILDLFTQHAPQIAADLQLARDIAVPLQPCLRDVWHDHVLFTGDEVTGLIDAHACRSDNVTIDLARLLGSLVADDRAAWDMALHAYQQVRPLSLAELGLVELFDRSGVLLSGMTWLDWLCLQGRRFDHPERILPRLEAILRRLENQSIRAGRVSDGPKDNQFRR